MTGGPAGGTTTGVPAGGTVTGRVPQADGDREVPQPDGLRHIHAVVTAHGCRCSPVSDGDPLI